VSEQPGTAPAPEEDAEQHADLPADAASRGELPEGGEPTPGSDNDGAEAGYSPPSGTPGS
jgi:hypothetical protein